MTSFPLGIASKPSNIVDGLQILAAHVSAAWDEVVGIESELLGAGTGQFILDIRPTAVGSVVLQSRQNTGDTQPRVQLLGTGSLKWGSGTAATDITLARSGTRTLTLTGSEIITPGNTADTALLIKGLASQTGLLLDVQDSGAASKASITNAGLLTAVTIAATSGLTAPTKAPGTNTTDVATTAFVGAAITAGTPSGIAPGIMTPFAGPTPPTGWLLCDGSAVSRATYAALFGVIGTDYGAGNGSTTFNLPDPQGRAIIGSGNGTGLTARTRASNGGAETVVLTTSNLPSHDHGGTTGSQTASGTTASTSATGTVVSGGAHTHPAGTITAALIATLAMASGGSNNLSSSRFSIMGTGGSGVSLFDYAGVDPFTYGDTASAGAHSHTFTPTGHTHTFTSANHSHSIPAQGTGTATSVVQPWLAMPYIIKT